MKKVLSIALALLLLALSLSGLAEDGYKTGYAVVTALSGASATADAEGSAETDVALVGVILDAEGKIASAAIDFVQAAFSFTAEGKLTSDVSAAVRSKQELGDDYGMRKASKIGAEWNEQADALAAYVVGMTGDEVLAFEMDAGTATDADLLASVTVHINALVEGIYRATENAAELGAIAGDTVQIGTSATLSRSKDAAADAAGAADLYLTFAVATKNADGVATSVVIDNLPAVIGFDAAGQITTDLAVEPVSKNVLGDAYGMKAASSLGLEWNEQAAGFAALTVGKTAEEVAAMDLAGADVVSAATMSLDGLAEAVVKALS